MATRRIRRVHKRIKTHRKKHSRRTRRTQRGGTRQDQYLELMKLYKNCDSPETKQAMSVLKMHDCDKFQKLLLARRASSVSDFMEVVCYDGRPLLQGEKWEKDEPKLSYEYVFCQNHKLEYNLWTKFIKQVHSWISTRSSNAHDADIAHRLSALRPMPIPDDELKRRIAALRDSPTKRPISPPLSRLEDRMSKLNLTRKKMTQEEMEAIQEKKHNAILNHKFPLCLRNYIKSRGLPFEEEVELAHAIAKELSNLHKTKGQTTQQTLGIVPGTSNPLANHCPKLQEFLEHLERPSSASASASASASVEANADMIARLQAVLDDD